MNPVELRYPFSGPFTVRNSPADRVPSHGTSRFGIAYAIDLVPVDVRGRSAPLTLNSLIRPEPPGRFAGFGRVVLAPISGRVVHVLDAVDDHHAFRGFASIGYALTQGRRAAGGGSVLAGNHLIIQAHGDAFVALCHLRRGSITVRVGDAVAAGMPVAQCGNSGNSFEPHLHLQATETLDLEHAQGLAISFPGGLPRNGEIVTA